MLNIFFMVNKRFCHLSIWIYKQGYTVMLKHFHLWIPVFKSFGVCFWIQQSEFVVVASALLFLKLVANKVKNCGVLRSLLGQKENNKNKSIFHCQLWRQQKASCFQKKNVLVYSEYQYNISENKQKKVINKGLCSWSCFVLTIEFIFFTSAWAYLLKFPLLWKKYNIKNTNCSSFNNTHKKGTKQETVTKKGGWNTKSI